MEILNLTFSTQPNKISMFRGAYLHQGKFHIKISVTYIATNNHYRRIK